MVQWSVEEVAAWLAGRVGPAVVSAAREAGVSGRMLVRMTGAAWAELGVTSALEQVRLVAEVEEATLGPRGGAGADEGEVRKPGPQYPTDPEWSPSFWGLLTDKWLAYWYVRTPDGGAEHTRGWVVSMVNACKNPALVKQHVLRFLGMYNVIDLLTFTIDTTFLITMESKGSGPENWPTALALLTCASAALLSGLGCGGSCILYNTCSAVSVENFSVLVKTPAFIHFHKMVNDASMYGAMLTFTIVPTLLTYRLVVDLAPREWVLFPGMDPVEVHWAWYVPLLIIPIWVAIPKLGAMNQGVFYTTHYAMYGGLMADTPIAPLTEDPTWLFRSTPTEIAAWLNAETMRVGSNADPRECEAQASTAYAVATLERLDRETSRGREPGGMRAPLLPNKSLRASPFLMT